MISHSSPGYCYGKAALSLVANQVHHAQTIHVEIDYHFIREQIDNGIIHTFYVALAHQLADIFTKAFGKSQFFNIFSPSWALTASMCQLKGEYWS